MAAVPALSNTHDFLKSTLPLPIYFFFFFPFAGASMSGSASTILQALERSREGKDLIWRAVRTGCQESPIPPTPTTACGWARRASATPTCAWPSTATSASTSHKVGSACPAATQGGQLAPPWHCCGCRERLLQDIATK